MDGGSWHCTGVSDGNQPQKEEMKRGKMVVWRGLTNSKEKNRSKKKRRRKGCKEYNQSDFGIDLVMSMCRVISCVIEKGTMLLTESLQSCPTLCDPIDGSPPGSLVPGILQARTLEWVAISFSKAWKWKVKVKSLRRILLLAIPWTAAYQAPPSMGFSRQEYWSGVPFPSPKGTIYPSKCWVPKNSEER